MHNNNRGALLIAVSILTLVMMILAAGIVSMNASQVRSNRHQVQRVKAEQIAKWLLWRIYDYRANTPGLAASCPNLAPIGLQPPVAINLPVKIDATTVNEQYTYAIVCILVAGTDTYSITVTYPGQNF